MASVIYIGPFADKEYDNLRAVSYNRLPQRIRGVCPAFKKQSNDILMSTYNGHL